MKVGAPRRGLIGQVIKDGGPNSLALRFTKQRNVDKSNRSFSFVVVKPANNLIVANYDQSAHCRIGSCELRILGPELHVDQLIDHLCAQAHRDQVARASFREDAPANCRVLLTGLAQYRAQGVRACEHHHRGNAPQTRPIITLPLPKGNKARRGARARISSTRASCVAATQVVVRLGAIAQYPALA